MPVKPAAQRERRRERTSQRGKCVNCQRLGPHLVNGWRMCCHCYVRAGHEPAEWHPECMAAAAALRDAKR